MESRKRRLLAASLGGVAMAVAFGCATAPPASSSFAGEYEDRPPVVKASTIEGASIASIEQYLQHRSSKLRTPRPGVWHMTVDGILVMMIADAGRVRILAPIFALNQLDGDPEVQRALLVRLLQSNFERAVDARYAVFDGIVFAAVTHPRKSLEVADLEMYLMQVVNLHKNTFRTGERGYSSLPPDPDSAEVDPRTDESLVPPAPAPGAPEPAAPPRPKIVL